MAAHCSFNLCVPDNKLHKRLRSPGPSDLWSLCARPRRWSCGTVLQGMFLWGQKGLNGAEMQRQKPNNWSTGRAAERRLGRQEKAPRAHAWHQEGSTLPILHRASPPSLSISLPCFIFLHSAYHPPLTIIYLFVTCLLPVCAIWNSLSVHC